MALDFQQDAIDVFFDTDEFAETIEYHPRGGGDSRDIKAIIDRGVPDVISEIPSNIAKEWLVSVINSATVGVSATEWDKGDRFKIPVSMGVEEMEFKTISKKPVRNDSGVLVFEVR